MKTILLTGATGFLGSHLLDALLKEHYTVIVLKRSTSDVWRIKHLLDQVKMYDVDVQDIELAFSEQKINIVIHTACSYGRNAETISGIVETNLMFGLKILDECLKYGVQSFINTDTFFNNGEQPQNHLRTYTLSKKQFVDWLYANFTDVQVINLKLQHVYGINDDVSKFLPWVISQLKKKVPEIKFTSGLQERDFIYIDDVVSAYLTILKNQSSLFCFNEYDVGTGNLISVKDFIEKIFNIYEEKFGSTTTRLKFGEIPLSMGEIMTVDVNNAALIELGWNPVFNEDKGVRQLFQNKS